MLLDLLKKGVLLLFALKTHFLGDIRTHGVDLRILYFQLKSCQELYLLLQGIFVDLPTVYLLCTCNSLFFNFLYHL